MPRDNTHIGLRLLEFETGLASNIDDTNSAELVDYEASRIAGQAARVAMLVKGQDVIDDEVRLKKLLAVELGLSGPEYSAVKRALQDADLLEERITKTGKHVLNEKVERLNHGENYRRIGELWLANTHRTDKEDALIQTMETVIQTPTEYRQLGALHGLAKSDRIGVIELGSNAGLIDSLEPQGLFFSPLLWDVNPKKLAQFVKAADATSFRTLLQKVRGKAGLDVTSALDPLTIQAISGGILPSYRVKSTAGERVYSFSPYTGTLLTSENEKTILDKARALVSCLRYGNEAATVTKIRKPLLILNALMSEARDHRVGPHSELKQQYGMLVTKQLGKVVLHDNGRFSFELIATPDNLRACRIAAELISVGEIMGDKDPGAEAAVHLVSGTVGHPLKEIRVAKKKRAARSDELADLIERLQSVG